MKYYIVHIFFVCYFCISTGLAGKAVVEVSTNDLTFGVKDNGSFVVSLSYPAPDNITIYFNYSEGNSLYPLPDGYEIPEGSTGNIQYNVQSKRAGHTIVLVKTAPPILSTKDAFVRVAVYKVHGWVIFSNIIGWLYFISWSVSFYPQIINNYRRKSVVGLNFDFLGLNLTGFIAYSVFNIGLKYVQEVKQEYHSINPTGVIPVEVNDVVFAVHAVFATVVCIGQCFIYERGDQLISKTTVAVLALAWSTAAVFLLLTALNINKHTPWLTFLYFFSYVKLGVTLTKYIPQAVFNYKRKSTSGWSIGTVMFDIVGGLFSIGQMFIIAENFNDWYSIVGNFTKFGLGLASITFDIIFMIQHFILYRKKPDTDSMENSLMA